MDVSRDAIEWLTTGYQPEFGARLLRRAIRAQLDRKLSRMLLAGELNPGRVRVLGRRGGDLRASPLAAGKS